MTCRDAILSNEFVDYIWKIDLTPNVPEELPYGLCAQYINRNFAVFYVSREMIMLTPERLPIGDYALPACYAPLNTESLEETRILPVQNQPALSLRGKGVILGFVDSGLAMDRQVFRRNDGSTRVLEFWDQTDQSGTPPQGFLYGSRYGAELIEKWLEEGMEQMPGMDEDGHGTKIASIAAGSSLENENFIGAAPESDLVFVKLKQAKPFIRELQQIPKGSAAYQESDIMLAIRYLDQVAFREQKPLVVCLALGSNAGGHSGNTALAQYLDDLARRAGRAVVTAAGNEGNQRHHFFGIVPKDIGYVDMELRVGEGENGFQLNLWGNAPGAFSAEITSPSGEQIPRIYPGILSRQRYDLIFEDTILDVQYELSEVISGDERLLISFWKPTPGIWRIRVYGSGDLENSFHAWLPITRFVKEDTYFLRPDPDTTVVSPGNTDTVITVSGYDGSQNRVWLDAGRGYTRDGRIKPDIAAPSVSVACIDRFGRSSTLTGTSASAALTAGAAALMMEWGIVQGNVPAMDSVTIQRFLIRGAERPTQFSFPNQNWGYGLLDLYGSFQTIRGIMSSDL